jgi:hypothetical protein
VDVADSREMRDHFSERSNKLSKISSYKLKLKTQDGFHFSGVSRGNFLTHFLCDGEK